MKVTNWAVVVQSGCVWCGNLLMLPAAFIVFVYNYLMVLVNIFQLLPVYFVYVRLSKENTLY